MDGKTLLQAYHILIADGRELAKLFYRRNSIWFTYFRVYDIQVAFSGKNVISYSLPLTRNGAAIDVTVWSDRPNRPRVRKKFSFASPCYVFGFFL